jgi:hypothetical protein
MTTNNAKESTHTMTTKNLTRYQMPEDGHKVHRIALMGLIRKGELFRARGRAGLYRSTTGNTVERCSAVDDRHVQVLIDIGFAGEDTRSVTRKLAGENDAPIRLNPLFLGTTGNQYYGSHWRSA